MLADNRIGANLYRLVQLSLRMDHRCGMNPNRGVGSGSR
jgi:hypothetical protein